MIELNGVRKVYDQDIVAVGDITATIEDGEFVSILGPSGCGKSTLLFMLGGFLEQTSGEITLDGEPVEEPGPDRGMVFQDSVLYPWLTIQDNIEWGMKIQGVPTEERRAKAREFIELIGLEGFEDAYPKSLSGGMKQRAAMARVLVANPDVLLMDEPFGALDAQTREMMQDELLDIWEQTGQTVVFVTHSIEEALYLSDRILVLSSRPSTVTQVVDVTSHFARPRSGETKKSPEFAEIRWDIWNLIKSEAEVSEGEGQA